MSLKGQLKLRIFNDYPGADGGRHRVQHRFGQVLSLLKLPIILDSIGTVLVA